ncbi:unnamed protein product [Cyprideis torosa]|uniref:E3 ubiquitin-protein transferase MAEA n=1 Tax=Cyprideis torosa TaxID=163714 RepID=A0A7R8W7C2_9CRUS|nr:unnamed protein product [Cyprideis torosa]CAG0882041.1 unnamed protein product [Cyprideis torosa]
MSVRGAKMPLPPAELPQDKDLIEVGINFHEKNISCNPILEKIKRGSINAKELTRKACGQWKLENPEDFCLMREDNLDLIRPKDDLSSIPRGSVLIVVPSPAFVTRKVLEAIQPASPILSGLESGNRESISSFHSIIGPQITESIPFVETLPRKCRDGYFAEVFSELGGHQALITVVREQRLVTNTTQLSLVLEAIWNLYHTVRLDFSDWPDGFIKRLAALIPRPDENRDVVRWALENLLAFLSHVNEPGLVRILEKLSFRDLETPLSCASSPVVQRTAVELVNALLSEAIDSAVEGDAEAEERLAEMFNVVRNRFLCSAIYGNILGDNVQSLNEPGMGTALLQLQRLTLSQYRTRMCTMAEMDTDKVSARKILELREMIPPKPKHIGQDADVEFYVQPSPRSGKDAYKALGFCHDVNPLLDFTETPPGILALDCIYHYAQNYNTQFKSLILEAMSQTDPSRSCPFGKASIKLVKIIVELLGIGDSSEDEGCGLQPILFVLTKPVEELYSLSIPILVNNWCVMKATTEDLNTVLSVSKEQISRTLAKDPPVQTVHDFRAALEELTYERVTDLLEAEEKEKLEREQNSQPIQELRRILTPGILELIAEQRLRYLSDKGGVFHEISRDNAKVFKDKFRFCRLAPNRKCLCYGPFDPTQAPPLGFEQLPHKLWLNDCREVVTKRECPLVKQFPNKFKAGDFLNNSFALLINSEEEFLHFVAKDQETFDYWLDGLNAALKKRSSLNSDHYARDLDILLNMELNIRLLDAEGVQIPDVSPSIPPLPDSFEFCMTAPKVISVRRRMASSVTLVDRRVVGNYIVTEFVKSSQQPMADVRSLEHHTLKVRRTSLVEVPYEVLNKRFRSAQKTIDRETSHITTATQEIERKMSGDGSTAASTPQIRNLVEGVVEKLAVMKRKAQESLADELEAAQLCKKRLDHIKESESPSPVVHSAWKAQRVDRMLVDYFLRQGYYKTALELVRSSGLQDVTNVDLFLVLREVEDSLGKHETHRALTWCHDNKSRLRKIKSSLEFKLRQQEVIEAIKNGNRLEAVKHAWRHFQGMEEEHLEEIQKTMALLAFPSDTGMEEEHLEEIQKTMALLAFPSDTDIGIYKDLFSEKRWQELIQQFKTDNYKLYQLSNQPVFTVALQAGLSALKTQKCYKSESTNPSCPVCTDPFRTLARPLPFAHCSQSRLICPVDGTLLNEHNHPMMLPNGHVFGESALQSMAHSNDGRVTCPKTREVFHINDAERIFVM